MSEKGSSYVDYEALLSPSFSPSDFANSIILATNNPTDVPLDLSTPLSKVLFDTQEINTTIDTLASNFALPLLNYTQEQVDSSANIARVIDSQISNINESYKRLEKEVIKRYETAEETRKVCERLWETARLGRSMVRCLQLGRQLEIQFAEAAGTGNPAKIPGQKEDHVALLRCSNTILSLYELLSNKEVGEEGYGLERVEVIKSLQNSVINPAESLVLSKSQKLVREFSITSQSSTISTHIGELKAKTVPALTALYLLSLTSSSTKKKYDEKWVPELLVNALQEYLQAAVSSSLTSLSRALASLPTLDRILLEISLRCQNIVVLESILSETTPPPLNAIFSSNIVPPQNFLQLLLERLETSSLPSWFWRALASGLNSKMTEFVRKGGASVRTLRSNRNSVKEAIRECVVKGTEMPEKSFKNINGNWEREILVMVGSVIGPLGRTG
ncbi:Conserved oligomeric Golgi complex subunit 5 [Erysiphe neolycopersici]|uniref:Conserved oligomeric Golgi complex subunit 5 n=1 Tax=Erysiphe neolycopersici TaxID=212602 RepID=A0A420HXF4_9PEZI|nr:Conserved oligomeric Golgi complex subunit 5 [Erysiphe neolycopersici]